MGLRSVIPALPALLLVAFFGFFPADAQAQMPVSSSTTSTPIPGAGHDYLGEIGETINPSNGSVSFRLNAMMPPGRGLTLPFSFAYDSNGVNYVGLNSGGVLEWLTPPYTVTSTGGWSNSVPVVSVSELTWKTVPDGSKGVVNCFAWVNYVYQDPHGNRHNLNLTTYNEADDNPAGYCTVDSSDWPRSFSGQVVTQGGDGFSPPYQGSLLASIPANATVTPGPITIAEADGTVANFPTQLTGTVNGAPTNSALATSVEDRNGNVVTINPPVYPATSYSYIDTAGRTVLQDTGFAVSPETVTIPGLGGSYTLTWQALSTPTFSAPITVLSGSACGSALSGHQWTETQYAVSTLTLPNGKSFSFTYDSTYSVVNKMTYPTGGYIRYVWGINTQAEFGQNVNSQPNDQCSELYGVPVMTDRYVSFNGSTEVLHQHFVYSTAWSDGCSGTCASWTSKQTTVTTTDQVRNTSYNTVYTYAPFGSDRPPNSLPPTNQEAVEKTIAYYDISGALLKTVTKTWANNRLLASQTTTYPTGPANETTWSYNSREQQIQQNDYDFGTSGVGSLLKEVVTNYQQFNNTPLYPDAPSIVDRPCQVITYDITGTSRVAETDYFYDNGATSTPCGAAGTLTCSPLSEQS